MRYKVLKAFPCAVTPGQVLQLAKGQEVDLGSSPADIEGLVAEGFIEAAKPEKKAKAADDKKADAGKGEAKGEAGDVTAVTGAEDGKAEA